MGALSDTYRAVIKENNCEKKTVHRAFMIKAANKYQANNMLFLIAATDCLEKPCNLKAKLLFDIFVRPLTKSGSGPTVGGDAMPPLNIDADVAKGIIADVDKVGEQNRPSHASLFDRIAAGMNSESSLADIAGQINSGETYPSGTAKRILGKWSKAMYPAWRSELDRIGLPPFAEMPATSKASGGGFFTKA